MLSSTAMASSATLLSGGAADCANVRNNARHGAPGIILLQDVPAEILVFHDSQQPLPNGGSVEHDVLDGIIGQLEEHFLEQRREYRVQPPGPDVLHALVHLGGDPGDLFDAIGGELERRTVGRTEGGV